MTETDKNAYDALLELRKSIEDPLVYYLAVQPRHP